MFELPDSLQNQLKSCRTLPSVPTVVIEVLDLCEQEDTDISEISKVLTKDPALATKVLKIANSALYSARSQIKTVDRAISLMGTNATLSLALSFSFIANLGKSQKEGFNYSVYWKRSAITATAARALTEWTSEMSREELFLAGLLQDLGMLVLNEGVGDTYGELVASANQKHDRLVQLENESLGTDHGTVGAWMLKRWKLPDDIINSVAASHNLQILEKDDKSDTSAVLALAGHIAEIWCDPDTADATETARQYATDLLGISDEKFDSVLGNIVAVMPEITQSLDIDFGGEEQANKLLSQAREALVILNLQAQSQVNQMRNLAETDGLTSLYNRGYLEKILPQYFSQAAKSNMPLGVIFVDIDHFKKVNDNYGHQVGDNILASVASILKSAMRGTDIAARYGGEEFVCLLPQTPEEGMELVAERLRATIASSLHRTDNNQEVKITASFGCAIFSNNSIYANPAELLEEADRRLYVAKREGRNRVISATKDSALTVKA